MRGRLRVRSLSHSLHSLAPEVLIRVFAAEYSCPFGQCVITDSRPRSTVRARTRRLFSACVTGSRWSGLQHARFLHRWSMCIPSGMGPTVDRVGDSMRPAPQFTRPGRELPVARDLVLLPYPAAAFAVDRIAFVESIQPGFHRSSPASIWSARLSSQYMNGPWWSHDSTAWVQ